MLIKVREVREDQASCFLALEGTADGMEYLLASRLKAGPRQSCFESIEGVAMLPESIPKIGRLEA